MRATVAKLSAVVLDHLIPTLLRRVPYLKIDYSISTLPTIPLHRYHMSLWLQRGRRLKMRWPLYHAAKPDNISQTRLCRPSTFHFEHAFGPPSSQRSSHPRR